MAQNLSPLLVCVTAVALTSVAPAQEDTRRRSVKITAADGSGVPGVMVGSVKTRGMATTDLDGVAEVSDAANADLHVRCGGDLETISAGDRRSEFLAEALPELVVTAVRADSGKPVVPASGTLEIAPSLRADLSVDPRSGGMRRPAVAVDWDPQVAEFSRPQRVQVVMRGEDPDLISSASVEVPAAVSALVRRLDVIVPVRKRCRIRLRALDEEGAPLEGAQVTAVRWEGSGGLAWTPAPYTAGSKSAADGVLEVGVPHLAEDAVSVRVMQGSWAENHWEGDSGPIALRPGVVSDSVVTLSRAGPSEGPATGAGWGVGGTAQRRPPKRPGSLVVLVTDAAGRPLPRAAVVVDDGQRHHALADLQGIARFTELESGTVELAFADRALRPVTAAAKTVAAGADGICQLAEPEGRDLDVAVAHEDGEPVAFAEVVCAAGDREFWPLIDCAWRSRLTDVAGRLRIPGAPRGAVTLTITYGSRRVTARVAADHRGTVRVTLPSALR